MNEEQYWQKVALFYGFSGELLEQMSVGTFGLAAASGRVAELMNGVLFEGQKLEVVECTLAMGKALRFLVLLCDALGCSSSQLMEGDIAFLCEHGLAGRQFEGSANREDASLSDDYCFAHVPGGRRCVQCQEMSELAESRWA